MRIALVNPNWSFEGSIYFGCREPHLPLEYGYSKALLEAEGHEAAIIDGQLMNLSPLEIRDAVEAVAPDMTVITTAPSYLFWRCAPPELRIPQLMTQVLRECGGLLVIVGPHGSTTPIPTLEKTAADVVIMGECEEVLVQVANTPRHQWDRVPSIAFQTADGATTITGLPHASDLRRLPALAWDDSLIQRHAHHHHRFDAAPLGTGAEMETSRGCPYHCSFCAKDNFRNRYRKRPLDVILTELDGLLAQGVEYVYFIDEIFLPNPDLLAALIERRRAHPAFKFGVQTRIDLWEPALIDQLSAAGCVSVEVGIESITVEGRARLDKNCKLSTDELTDRLIHAKRAGIAFVQANLIDAQVDEAADIDAWRAHLQAHGVWANKPVPLFPYPGSPDYVKLWGIPDDQAWERAHHHYLTHYVEFSDIQEYHLLPLPALEMRPDYVD
ncbi:MAG: TIGR04295 family B12-binding domain-containing radical SAM protein [bacterium]|nr:TIGR04295 family B12-binding domain-containing radical SAM protein [bacterium]